MAHTRNAPDEDAEILERFDSFRLDPETVDALAEVRHEFQSFVAEVVLANAPGSRERSNALTALEQAKYWTNQAIARHGLRQ